MADYNPNAVWTSKKKEYPDYSKAKSGGDPQIEVVKTPPHSEPPSMKAPQKNLSSKNKILMSVGIALALIVIAGALYLIFKPAPALNVAVTFANPQQVLVGEPFVLSVSYANYSQTVLQNATLSLTLPAGISFEGEPQDQRVMQQSVGEVGSGSNTQQNFNLIVTGSPSSVLQLNAKLTYNTAASPNDNLASNATANLAISEPAVGLTITAPSSVFSGQNFTVTVAYVNNSGQALPDTQVALQYPSAFTFADSTAMPATSQNNSWDLGPLAVGESGSFTITGSMVGESNAPYSFVGAATTDYMGTTYTIANPTVNLAIAPSPLEITGSLNNTTNYVAGLDDNLQYIFAYTNNSSATLLNAVVTAKFTGAMYDFSTLRSNGSFNSVNNTLTFSPANTPALASIAPGQSGTVTVQMNTLKTFPIRLPSDKDYTLKAQVQIQSPTVPPGTDASSTISLAGMTNQVAGETALAAIGYWNDPTSAINNSGPYPPKVDKQTQYTIHWQITNYSTDIANVTVSAYLQSGTTCTGKMTTTVASTTVTCNAANGLVTWTIPYIAATTGVISGPAQAVFQVENTPAVNEVGQDVTLIGQTTLTATDEFTSSTIQTSAAPVTTALPEDPSGGTSVREVSN